MHAITAITDAITGKVLDIVLPIFATAAAGLVVAVLTQLLRKLGLQLDAEQSADVKRTVKDAIQALEEQSRRDLKAGRDPLTGPEKHEKAIDIVRALKPGLNETVARLALDAALPEVRKDLAPAPALPSVGGPTPDSPGTFGRPKDGQ